MVFCILKHKFYMFGGVFMKKAVVIESAWCKKCGICVEYCPVKILELNEDTVYIKDSEKCISCGKCEQRCPDYAIYLQKTE